MISRIAKHVLLAILLLATPCVGQQPVSSPIAGAPGYAPTAKKPGYWTLDANGKNQLIKHNLSGTTAPAVGDDSADGYSIGSIWLDTTNDATYVCVDATAGAAKWNALVAYTSGNYGVGTGSPARTFEILHSANPQLRLTQASGSKYADFSVGSDGNLMLRPTANELDLLSTASYPSFVGYRVNNSEAAPSPVLADTVITEFMCYGHDGTSYSGGGAMRVFAAENYDATHHRSRIQFYACSTGNAAWWLDTPIMTLYSDSVGIGTGAYGFPARKLEVLDATKPQLRLTQLALDQAYVDFQAKSDGSLVITPEGGLVGWGRYDWQGGKTITPSAVCHLFDTLATNDTCLPFFYGSIGADAVLGPLMFNIGAKPSATAGSRYCYLGAWDTGAVRPLVLGASYDGTTYGNVGIGAFPSERLEVGGNLKLTPSGNSILYIGRSSTPGYARLIFRETEYDKWAIGLRGDVANGGFNLCAEGDGAIGKALVVGHATGNVGIRTTTPGGSSTVGTGVLSLTNGTAPVGGVADQVSLYSADVSSSAELFAMDEAGNTPQLTPHPSDFLDTLPTENRPYPWAYSCENKYLGKRIQVDIAGLAAAVEKLTGEKFVFVTDIPKTEWDASQEAQASAKQAEIDMVQASKANLAAEITTATAELAAATKAVDDEKAKPQPDAAVTAKLEADKQKAAATLADVQKRHDSVKVPEPYTPRGPPKWMADRGVASKYTEK